MYDSLPTKCSLPKICKNRKLRFLGTNSHQTRSTNSNVHREIPGNSIFAVLMHIEGNEIFSGNCCTYIKPSKLSYIHQTIETVIYTSNQRNSHIYIKQSQEVYDVLALSICVCLCLPVSVRLLPIARFQYV